MSGSDSSQRESVVTTQDARFPRKVFSPRIVFCSQDKACLYAALNFRGPDGQQYLRLSVRTVRKC